MTDRLDTTPSLLHIMSCFNVILKHDITLTPSHLFGQCHAFRQNFFLQWSLTEEATSNNVFNILWLISGKKSLHKTNPLSLLVISILYTYPGGILSQLILGKPPLLFLTNTAQFLSFMAVWYIMFYTRLNTLLVNSYTLPLLLLAQDLMRLSNALYLQSWQFLQ